MSIFEKLNFAGIRLIAVSQGIDSENEQAHVLVTVHGMVDSLYVKEKELAKKTHRGLEGLMLRGQHNENEAAVVRRIFEMSAEGQSLKAIAKTLNGEHIPPPRPRAGKRYATWCPTCIRAMLRRDLYAGKVIWNSSRFVKVRARTSACGARDRRANGALSYILNYRSSAMSYGSACATGRSMSGKPMVCARVAAF